MGHNAADVAAATAAMATDIDACLIAIAGDVRAKTLVAEALPAVLAEGMVTIEAGSPAGIADEVVRQLSDLTARRITELADRLRTALAAAGTATVEVRDVGRAERWSRGHALRAHGAGGIEPSRELGSRTCSG